MRQLVIELDDPKPPARTPRTFRVREVDGHVNVSTMLKGGGRGAEGSTLERAQVEQLYEWLGRWLERGP